MNSSGRSQLRVTVFRSQLLLRPGFFRFFDLGDHVGAEVGQLPEGGHRHVAGETW